MAGFWPMIFTLVCLVISLWVVIALGLKANKKDEMWWGIIFILICCLSSIGFGARNGSVDVGTETYVTHVNIGHGIVVQWIDTGGVLQADVIPKDNCKDLNLSDVHLGDKLIVKSDHQASVYPIDRPTVK